MHSTYFDNYHEGIPAGYYVTDNPPEYQPGLYRLTVSVPGHEPVTASDSIPRPVKITSVSYLQDSLTGQILYTVFFKDNPDQKNFYGLSVDKLSYYDTREVPDFDEYILSPNSFVEATLYNNYSQLIFSDKTFSSPKQQVSFRLKQGGGIYNEDSVIYRIKLLSISENYYDYAISYYNQRIAEKDFYSEPVNVFSNIKNGYGIFAGYSYSAAEVVWKREGISVRVDH